MPKPAKLKLNPQKFYENRGYSKKIKNKKAALFLSQSTKNFCRFYQYFFYR